MNAASLRIAGVSITYTPMSPPAAAVEVTVIENDAEPPERISPGHFASISLRPSDLPQDIAEEDEVTLREITYRVRKIVPGSPGEDWATLDLHQKR